jgi:hypothetical protein
MAEVTVRELGRELGLPQDPRYIARCLGIEAQVRPDWAGRPCVSATTAAAVVRRVRETAEAARVAHRAADAVLAVERADAEQARDAAIVGLWRRLVPHARIGLDGRWSQDRKVPLVPLFDSDNHRRSCLATIYAVIEGKVPIEDVQRQLDKAGR